MSRGRGEGKGDGALKYRVTPRRVQVEDIEQLEGGPDSIGLNS